MSTQIDPKIAKRMRRCPKCRRQTVRIRVDLFLDIDVKWSHRLSKATIRDPGIKLDGAGWPSAQRYCAGVEGDKKWCGWEARGA